MPQRIFAFFALVFSLFFMPFWVSVILAIIGMFYFPIYFEAVLLFFLSDLLYGTKEAKFFEMIFVSFFLSLILLISIEILKKKLKFYK
jgi:hypothetical protein